MNCLRKRPARLVLVFAGLLPAGCSSSPPSSAGPSDAVPDPGTRMDSSATVDTGTTLQRDGGRAPAPGDDGGPALSGDASVTLPDDGAAPPNFWDTSDIPPAKNVMTFKFLNRTNGKFTDSQVFWSFKSGSISETHSIAEAPTYDMPANNSGRMYFYLCAAGDPTNCTGDPTQSKYYDFIEHTIGATQYNGNTTRVDAFGLKIAMRLHCADGYDVAVGEDYETFLEDRAATFQKFLNEVPAEFQELAQAPNAPYRIVEPGAGQFKTGGTYADYYDDFVNQMWANNGLTIAKPGPNGSGLASYPDVSAAIFRHVGDKAGSFTAAGKLMDKTLWSDSTTFYTAAPANYYARFWHTHALNGKAYGFPYDDVGGYSSYISHANPQYMLVAIGW
jgi:hypothetical protein